MALTPERQLHVATQLEAAATWVFAGPRRNILTALAKELHADLADPEPAAKGTWQRPDADKFLDDKPLKKAASKG
jgi:hypothetical protein